MPAAVGPRLLEAATLLLLTAGAALANPNSTVALLNLQKQRADAAAGEVANRAGTYYGGGLQSGLAENQRVNVAQNQDAVTKLITARHNGAEDFQIRNLADVIQTASAGGGTATTVATTTPSVIPVSDPATSAL